MRGLSDVSAKAFDAERSARCDPPSVSFADTFSRKGRRTLS